MQHPASTGLTSGRKWTLTALFITFLCFVMLHQQFFPVNSIPALRGSNHNYSSTIGWPIKALGDDSSSTQDPLNDHRLKKPLSIPNIIHFVRLVEDPNRHNASAFNFTFHQFVAIYSAHYYMQPETIYIHTNVPEHLIHVSLEDTTNLYARAINKFPNIKYNYHFAPNRTTNGREIENLPHRSDFVRADILQKFGGIYLDDDVYLLRELHTLRHIGYESIVGRQSGGNICNAVIMSTPGNKMITAYNALMNPIYDGGWETHSVFLLTSVAQEFASVGNQVMILPQDTFFPLSWEKADLETLYQVHNKNDDDIGELEPHNNNHNTKNLTEFIDNFTLWPEDSWRVDWRLSYVMHGWTSAIKQYFENTKELIGEYDEITLEYILARNSNFARAVYPAVKDALERGFLDGPEFTQGVLEGGSKQDMT